MLYWYRCVLNRCELSIEGAVTAGAAAGRPLKFVDNSSYPSIGRVARQN